MSKNTPVILGQNFKAWEEGEDYYFLETTDGYETEYCYLNELKRDINRGYIEDHYKGKIVLRVTNELAKDS